jgi:enoyl-CoA hydratase/carnithine racemase
VEAFILSAVEQGVMTITLNRPDRLNSFNDLMHQQLAECLKQAERDERALPADHRRRPRLLRRPGFE